jgi:hypothetical protein
MSVIDLGDIWYRSYSTEDIPNAPSVEIDGSIDLSSIKYRAYNKPAAKKITIILINPVAGATDYLGHSTLVNTIPVVGGGYFVVYYSGFGTPELNVVINHNGTPGSGVVVQHVGDTYTITVATDATAQQFYDAINSVSVLGAANFGANYSNIIGTFTTGAQEWNSDLPEGYFYDEFLGEFIRYIYIYMPTAIASVKNPVFRILTTSIYAVATASISVPIPKITVVSSATNANASSGQVNIDATTSPPATATASISSPTVIVSVASIATSTASIVAPTLSITGGNPVIVSPPASATAQVETVIVVISVTSVAMATASIVAPVPEVKVTSIGIATASVAVPVIEITGVIVSPPAGATAQISTITPVITAITTISASTAEISTITPIITITGVSIATASIVSPVITSTDGDSLAPFAVGEKTIGEA